MRYAVCLTLIFLISATPALAQIEESDARRWANETARSYWKDIRPKLVKNRCGGVKIRIDWRGPIDGMTASAPMDGCRRGNAVITVDRRDLRSYSRVGACAVITHEVGHLLGFRHTRRDRSLMSGVRSPGDGQWLKPPRRATWERAWKRCG